MYSRLQALLADLTNRFHNGDFAGVIGHYDFPLPLEMEDRKVLITRPAEMERLLRALHHQRKSARFAATEPEIMAVELPRRRRFRLWVRYHHLDAAGMRLDHSDRIFHCRDRGVRVLIEGLQVTRLPLTEMRTWLPRHRISA